MHRDSKQKDVEFTNVKLAFHINRQSASIDVKKQFDDFAKHEKRLSMHGKYKNNKVWGGTIGAVGHTKSSPKSLHMSQKLRLPPLSNKPIFTDASQVLNDMSVSNLVS